MDERTHCLKHVDVEYNNYNSKYRQGHPTVLQQLEVARYATPIVFEVPHNVPGEPPLRFYFLEPVTTWALNTLGIILTRAHTAHVNFS